MSNKAPSDGEVEIDEDPDLQKEVIGNWKLVDLPQITIVPPEANYDVLKKFDVKLYRFKNGEWNQRGQGQLKFIQHKQTEQVVLLMRQKKTFFIRANHFVIKTDELCVLSQSLEHEHSWIWSAKDISDGVETISRFSVELQNQQKANQFKAQFENSCLINQLLAQSD